VAARTSRQFESTRENLKSRLAEVVIHSESLIETGAAIMHLAAREKNRGECAAFLNEDWAGDEGLRREMEPLFACRSGVNLRCMSFHTQRILTSFSKILNSRSPVTNSAWCSFAKAATKQSAYAIPPLALYSAAFRASVQSAGTSST